MLMASVVLAEDFDELMPRTLAAAGEISISRLVLWEENFVRIEVLGLNLERLRPSKETSFLRLLPVSLPL